MSVSLTWIWAGSGALDLGTALSGTGPFTVFAPTNAAFTALADPTASFLMEPANKATLAKILKYRPLLPVGRYEVVFWVAALSQYCVKLSISAWSP